MLMVRATTTKAVRCSVLVENCDRKFQREMGDEGVAAKVMVSRLNVAVSCVEGYFWRISSAQAVPTSGRLVKSDGGLQFSIGKNSVKLERVKRRRVEFAKASIGMSV